MTLACEHERWGGVRRAAREELRRQLLALVLACVLVWYTLVVPASAATPARALAGRRRR